MKDTFRVRWVVLMVLSLVFTVVGGTAAPDYEDELLGIQAELGEIDGQRKEAYDGLQSLSELLTQLDLAMGAGDSDGCIDQLVKAEWDNYNFEKALSEVIKNFLEKEKGFLEIKEDALKEAKEQAEKGNIKLALLILKVEEEIGMMKAKIARDWLTSSIREEELCIKKKLFFYRIFQEKKPEQGS